MAFYLALFNVNHVNDEVKHSVSHARRSKSVKPVLKDKNRRHSLSSTQEVADYRLLPRPRIIGSSHNIRQLRRSPSPPPPNRRTSAADSTLCNCDVDSPENGKVPKVTFEETSMLTVERPRRKLSEGSFLGNREALNQSCNLHQQHLLQNHHPNTSEMEEELSSHQRAQDWIYSIKLQQKKDHLRRMSQQERGLLNNDCVPSSNVEPLIQKRPQSKLPSILRRRSTSDRSASLAVVFRRAMPTYRSASPNHHHHLQNISSGSGNEGIKQSRIPQTKLKSSSHFHSNNQHQHSDNIPLIDRERNEMIRSNYY
uniref:Uncharacterized protein n=1 Tax=Panagrolaimus sp. ES5 TaxID=591445 RepID=A0AC34GXT7_9BILA